MSISDGEFSFELFCIDPADINTEIALAQALSFSKSLWMGYNPVIKSEKGVTLLREKNSNIEIVIKSVDTSKVITGFIESAFILNVVSSDFEKVEYFRLKLLQHLRNVLEFNYIRLLNDDISTFIANELYPNINGIENLLRKYLVKFFIQRIGLDWWEATANKYMIEKVKMHKNQVRDEISLLIDEDVRYVDFDDLGELIYKQNSGYNDPGKIISRLLSISNLEELELMKNELQTNYSKYFKENFQDVLFEQKWKELIKLRNKVAHQGIFYAYELRKGLELAGELKNIILNAEKKIDDIVFSIEDKEAIRNAMIDADFDVDLPKFKILGKVNLAEAGIKDSYEVISETEMLDELDYALKSPHNYYVGLKWFITTFLAQKGYSINHSYSLLNILIDKGLIEKYEILTPNGFVIIALKMPGVDAEDYYEKDFSNEY